MVERILTGLSALIVASFLTACSDGHVRQTNNQAPIDFGQTANETSAPDFNAGANTDAIPTADPTDNTGVEATALETSAENTPPATKAPVAATQPSTTSRIALRENVPDRYTVKRGDTLWAIATMFLKDAWRWPEIWYFNNNIQNPHLIYPGDVIQLVYVDGQPQLRLARDGTTVPQADVPQGIVTRTMTPDAPQGIKTVKLNPRAHAQSLESAIPTIPIGAIQPFLIDTLVVTKKQLEKAPYVVSSLDEHLVNGMGHTLYVRGLDVKNEQTRFKIYRPGRKLKRANSREVLGYEAVLVSEADLKKVGDPATLEVVRSVRETLNGDRILPPDEGQVSYNFVPKAPKAFIEGHIIALMDALTQTGQNQVVVIDLGVRDGMEPGTVLAIDHAGKSMQDHYVGEKVRMPDARAGLLMVFKAFERVSYALVMQSSRPVRLNDFVRNPAPVGGDKLK
ncbi:MAG: LysM peptidoglycan-binding domain-containing protein [Gammaproteobacteria bacterium]|nr:LysM peptidoglycan-binding domain-containing protein [Gammaproteobacteria bacterium]